MPFLCSNELFLNAIADSFEANAYMGQIVGPHGCGKTTVTYDLQSRLCEKFKFVRRVTIRGARAVNGIGTGSSNTDPQLLIIDGVERMSAMNRWLLIQSCRKRRTGILVTTHKRIEHLPVLCELHPTPATFGRIVQHLAPRLSIEMEFLTKVLRQSDGNIREALMQLYDWFESGNGRLNEVTEHRLLDQE